MGRIKRKIRILLRFVRQVVRGVACHAMFTTYDYPIGLKASYEKVNVTGQIFFVNRSGFSISVVS